MKFLAFIALFFTFTFAANAQRGDGQRLAPEDMAEKETTRMVEKLSLDQTQAAKIKEINLAYAKKMQEAREGNTGNRSAMQEIATAINNEKATELKTVLTAEQYKTYEQMEAGRAKGKGKPGGGGKRGDK